MHCDQNKIETKMGEHIKENNTVMKRIMMNFVSNVKFSIAGTLIGDTEDRNQIKYNICV